MKEISKQTFETVETFSGPWAVTQTSNLRTTGR